MMPSQLAFGVLDSCTEFLKKQSTAVGGVICSACLVLPIANTAIRTIANCLNNITSGILSSPHQTHHYFNLNRLSSWPWDGSGTRDAVYLPHKILEREGHNWTPGEGQLVKVVCVCVCI